MEVTDFCLDSCRERSDLDDLRLRISVGVGDLKESCDLSQEGRERNRSIEHDFMSNGLGEGEDVAN